MSWQNSTSRVPSDVYLQIINEPEYWLTLAVVGFALSAVTVVANSILLATIWHDPLRSLRTPPCLLIANLGLADLLVGLCVIPMVTLRDVYRSFLQMVPLPSIVGTITSCILSATLFVSSATISSLLLRHRQSHSIQDKHDKEENLLVDNHGMDSISSYLLPSGDDYS